jgi:hypothetical protein
MIRKIVILRDGVEEGDGSPKSEVGSQKTEDRAFGKGLNCIVDGN